MEWYDKSAASFGGVGAQWEKGVMPPGNPRPLQVGKLTSEEGWWISRWCEEIRPERYPTIEAAKLAAEIIYG